LYPTGRPAGHRISREYPARNQLSRGSAAPPAPATALNWTGQAAGTGTVTLRWPVRSGNWMLVVMNRDASAGVTV
jgi:hypothetical protein